MIQKKLFKQSYDLFTRSFFKTFSYTILLRVLLTILLLPLLYYFFDLLIKTKGVDFIGNRDMLNFFLSGYILILLPATVFLLLLMVVFEFGGLVLIVNRHLLGEKFYIKLFLQDIWISIKNIIKKGLFKFLFFSLVMLPLAMISVYVLVLIFLEFWGENFLSSDFWVAVAIFFAMVLILLMIYYFFIKGMFAIHITYIDRQNFAKSLKQSKDMTKKKFNDIFFNLFLWICILVIPFVFLKLGINNLIDFIIPSGSISENTIIISSFFVFLDIFLSGLFILMIYPFIISFITILYYGNTSSKFEEKDLNYKKNYLINLGIILLILIINLGGALFVYFEIKGEIEVLDKKIIVAAHRGSSGMAPQNTMSAINLAIKNKADVMEFDVQETKDGVVVLMHDENVKKTSGINRNIWDMTYEEVQQLDVGSSFSKDFKGEKVPTLAQVLDAGKGNIKMLIEIKEYGHGKHIVQTVSDLINEKCIPGDCLLHSTDYHVLENFKKINPDIKIGYILTAGVGDFFKKDFDFFSVPTMMLTEDFIRQANEKNKELRIWTINDKESIDDMIVLGVDGIITDYPLIAQENLEYRNSLSDSEKIKMKVLKLVNN